MTEKSLLPKTANPKGGFTQLPLPLLINGEKLLQFIWQFGYFSKTDLATTDGEPLTVQFAGSLNKNAGPDFTAAKIRIGTTTLAGTVELHLKTSDWTKHRHEDDPAYKNVVLHAVFEHDKKVNNIPVLELSSRISGLLLHRYAQLMAKTTQIPCGGSLNGVKELVWNGWKERLLVERLHRKTQAVLQRVQESKGHWEEVFWWRLARAFGGNINGDAFEATARSIPVNLLAKHKTSLPQIEALLMGQAGLLSEAFEEDYPKLLQREYTFLAAKYNLQPVATPVAFLRMRPVNFPTIRLAQLAALVYQTAHLFSWVLDAEDLAKIKDCFAITANDYWHYHYTFKQASAYKVKTLGDEMTANVIINTVVPALFAYGHYHSQEKLKEKALRWLDELPAETNNVTKEFTSLGVKNTSAYNSQALLELKNAYCSEKRCLECSVGAFILREAAAEYGNVSSNQ